MTEYWNDVTSYPLLVLLSIFVGLGIGGILATNVVYMTEMSAPAVRGKMTEYWNDVTRWAGCQMNG
jgi:MFS family permease